MKATPCIFFFLALLAVSCVTGGKEQQKDRPEKFTVRYQCDGGGEITVEYDNSDPEKSIAYVQLSSENPERVKMTVDTSASGARYTDGKLVWWTKGQTAFLLEEGNSEAPIYSDCREFEEAAL